MLPMGPTPNEEQRMDREMDKDRPVTPQREADEIDTEGRDTALPNPPRTKTGPIVAPKFGSAGSGGAELEPGPELD
jgi:hypothetical protein